MSRNLMLDARSLGCRFARRGGWARNNSFWALEDISFDLHAGDSLAIIGRNGAGKSTLLQILAGILKPDRGRVVRHTPSISLLSLNAGLEPSLTGRANAVISGMLLGMRRQDIAARLEDIKELSGLGDFFEQPVAIYSSGMQSRLGFATAFQLEPDVLLVDEVLGVGDTVFRKVSTGLMKDRLLSDRTVVLVSHSPGTVKELCNRALWIEHGRVEAIGPAAEVVEAYEDAMEGETTHG